MTRLVPVVLLLVALPAQAEPQWTPAIASWYRPTRARLACRGRMRLPRGLPIVAHRSLPCGTRLMLRRGGRTVRAVVADRGPWGVCCAGWTDAGGAGSAGGCPAGFHWRIAVPNLPAGCYWRGDFDLSRSVARRLRLLDTGIGHIEWRLAR